MHSRLLLSAYLASFSLFLHALPQNPRVLSGETSTQILQPGHLEIKAGHRAIVQWSDFSIAQNEKVHFVQPSSTSAILNRVQSKNPSHLLGQLLANGKVYLINPNGVIIGKDAIIRAADFLASTLDLSDEQFLSGKELLFHGASQEAVVNYGTIETPNGNIALLGRVVQNEGSLLAAQGKASLIAGQEILLTFEDIPIFSIRPSLTSDGTLSHTGKIEALIADLQAEGKPYTHGMNIQGSILAVHTVEQNGKIYLKANGITLSPTATLTAPRGRIEIEATENGLYNEGTMTAQEGTLSIQNRSQETPFYTLGTLSVSGEQGGKIEIETIKLINSSHILAEGSSSQGGSIDIHTHGAYIETAQGTLSTDGRQKGGTISLHSDTTLFSSGKHSSQGERGGEIALVAPQLTLVSAEINGSGIYQAGEIHIGGSTTKSAHLSGDTRLAANATYEGNGGKISVLAEEKNVCHGSICANAGQKGDGGFIEVSSGGEFFCGATLSAHAKNGAAGSVLLDPKNLTISSITGVYPQYELIDPNAGGGTGFGTVVAPLSTGNIVVTKPNDNMGGAAAGAVYLYNGLTAALLSTVIGSQANDQVGGNGITTLGNGNYVVRSNNWDNGAAANAGAVTFGNGVTGITGGVVSSSNSLVGTTANDQVGGGNIAVLTNGNYVVTSPNWDSGSTINVGAATFGNGLAGITGAVSSSNSLVGTIANDVVGNGGIVVLTNGNYVVRSFGWHNGAVAGAGAVTLGNGITGITGAVSSSNSLVGTTTGDAVGGTGVTALTNGNYVVRSNGWHSGATINVGAVTFGNGVTGVTGAVSSSNSLVGTAFNDQVGSGNVIALSNGNYVVRSPIWDNGAVTDAGAVTFGNGTIGIAGAVSSSNSLVGTTASDQVGNVAITLLSNGNYVVRSTSWDNGAATNAGAVTFGDGMTGITGAVSSSNSLVGTTANDQVGSGGITILTNGNYVVTSPNWDNGATTNAGAVTFGSGTIGIVGTVSSSNSLVGTTANDQVSSAGITVLTNGNYVVRSPVWNNGAATEAGAATFGNGLTGITGAVSSSNSLVGTAANDHVSTSAVIALTNGNYVVVSQEWDNGAATNAGAVTFGNGAAGITGAVSSSNSLVGTTVNDGVGASGVIGLANGNYVVTSTTWDNGAVVDVGAVTFGNGLTGITGAVSSSNSLVGTMANDQVGGVTALTNGNYVVVSPNWDNGANANAGAVTFGNGTAGITGAVSSSNSLVGTMTSDQVGSSGITILTNGNYVVRSPNWDNGTNANAGAATFGSGTVGVMGTVSSVNSVVGLTASAGLTSVFDDNIHSTFLANFLTEGSGKVRVGLEALDQITFARAQAQTMQISPVTLVATLNTGTDLILQTNNDLTISSAITSSPGAGDLTIRVGRSAVVNADIITGNGALTLIANDLLSNGVVDSQRDPGDAVLAVANGVTINTGTGSLTLSLLNGAGKTNAGSGDVTIGDAVTLVCAGSGSMSITAQEKNINIGQNSLLQTADGTLILTAGVDISALANSTLKTTGTGELILVCDALFPTPPTFGSGAVHLPQTTLQTNGGRLLIYTSQRALNTLPANINGIPYIPGPEFINSTTEKWGTYFPYSSGIPFTIFYKENGTSTVLKNALHANITALVEPFEKWRWYYDPFFINLFCWTLSDFSSFCLASKLEAGVIYDLAP